MTDGRAYFLYLIPYLVSLGMSSIVGVYAWRHRQVPGAYLYSWVVFSQAIWISGYIFELTSASLDAKIFWDNIEWIASIAGPILFLAFTLEYTNRKLINPLLSWILMCLIPGCYLILLYTDKFHNLIRPDSRLVPGNPFSDLVYSFTLPSRILYIYLAGLVLWSFILLSQKFFHAQRLYRQQIGLVIIGGVIPLIGTTLTILGITFTSNRDTSPITFAIGNLFVALGLFRLRLFDVTPVAREAVIENMHDALILMDLKNRVIDLNPAAEAFTGRKAAEVVGHPADIAFTSRPEVVGLIQGEGELHSQIEIDRGDKTHQFELSASTFYNRRKQPGGRLVLVRDITERVAAEKELEQYRKNLEKMVARRTIDLIETNKRLSLEIDERKRTESALVASQINYKALSERLANLRTIDRAILAAESPQAIAQAALNHLQHMIHFNRANIATLDFEAGQGTYLALIDESESRPELGNCFKIDPVLADMDSKLRNGEIHLVEDLASKTNLTSMDKAMLEMGVQAFAVIPLKWKGEVIASLDLAKNTPEAFDQVDLEIAQEVADQLSLAIQQARLFEQVQHHAEQLEQRVHERTAQLEAANQELEAFAYSVSHDLRAPLRGMDGYSQALLEDYSSLLDELGKAYLQYIREASHHMSNLIDDLLRLSRIMRSEIHLVEVDLSTIANEITTEFRKAQPQREAFFDIQSGLVVKADPQLIRILLQNLLDNAWKFTSKHAIAHIEVGETEQEGVPVYYVRDDGAGFNMSYQDKLFQPFQRLHGTHEFEGSGIGLATAKRIIKRHNGRVWAEGAVEKGATIYFTVQGDPL